jgi:polysaccharide pyruvyl transferase WcaK-like protein
MAPRAEFCTTVVPIRIKRGRPKESLLNPDFRRNKIGLLGPFSFGNLGNVALQQTLMEYLKKRFPDAEFYGCCIDPNEPTHARQVLPFPLNCHVPWPRKSGSSTLVQTKKVENQEKPRANREWVKKTPLFSGAYRRARTVWSKLKEVREELAFCYQAYRFAKEFRLLVVGLGGVFDEVWGGKWGDLYSYFRWAVLARLAGTPLVCLSVGVEEINTRLAKFFCRTALSLAAYRSFRDVESKKKVEAIGVMGENQVFPDLAFGLEHRDYSRTVADQREPRAVGVSPMAYCDPRFWPIKDFSVYQDYLKKLSSFVSWLLHDGYEVVLFPTQIGMDSLAIEELKALVLEELPPRPYARLSDAKLHNVEECLALLSGLSTVVTSRLHGIILASLVSTPVLAISPASKIDRLMEDMEMTEYLLNIQRIELSLLINRFKSLEDNHEIVRRTMQRSVARYRLAVETQFDLVFQSNLLNL